jgi:myo-inositol 2-dehydrogenase/D-chiro-inositol 1-dehydrogenase
LDWVPSARVRQNRRVSEPDNRPLRYGFAGVGMMGIEHLNNVLALPGAVPVAAADPHGPSLEAAVTAAGGELATYPDVESMVDAEQLDVVVVSTPNVSHRSVLEPLWGRPLHLMVEKPLCATVPDALAVRAAAADHPGVVWVGLEYRYMPPVARFVDEVAGGSAGRVVMLSIREHRYPFLVKVGDWNRFNRNTGGTLVEKCCHFFDLMRLVLADRPVRVIASGGQAVNHLDESYRTERSDREVPDILDNAFVVVDFAGGARALLDLCMFAEGSRWEQELVATGDAGKVEANVPGFMEVVRGRRPELVLGSRGPDWPVEVSEVADDDRVAVQGGHHGASYLEHLAMVDVVRRGERPQVGVDDGVWSVAMGVAAHRSIDEGRAVEMSEILPAEVLADLT